MTKRRELDFQICDKNRASVNTPASDKYMDTKILLPVKKMG